MNTVQIVFPILGTLLLFVIGTFMIIKDHLDRKRKTIEAGDAMTEESGNWDRFKKILDVCLFGFVTMAEREYGGGTGELKMSTVLLEVLKIIPDNLKGRIKLDVLKGYVEDALRSARKR